MEWKKNYFVWLQGHLAYMKKENASIENEAWEDRSFVIFMARKSNVSGYLIIYSLCLYSPSW